MTLDEDDLLALLAEVKTKDRFDIEFDDNIIDVNNDANHSNFELNYMAQEDDVKKVVCSKFKEM